MNCTPQITEATISDHPKDLLFQPPLEEEYDENGRSLTINTAINNAGNSTAILPMLKKAPATLYASSES